jgi:hypothetical protein
MTALVIYILSIGPVAHLTRAGYLSKNGVEVFYWPLLVTIHFLGPQTEKCLDAYVYLWGRS